MRMKNKIKHFFKKNKRRKIIILILLLLLLLLFFVIGLYISIVVKVNSETVKTVPAEEVDSTVENVLIAETEQKDDEVINVLLVGTDSRDPNSDMGRSDSMMLVSFNKTEQKATVISFLRDTLLEIDGHGKSRLGHTYAYGGAGLTINTLNKNYNLDIQYYITINFENMVSVIDEIGGVTVYISEEEAAYYQQNGMPGITSGNVTLTGSQALAHARNRTIGSDFERTRRQRSIMYGIYQKVMQEKDLKDLLPLINYCMNQVKTNMSVSLIYDLAKDVFAIDDLMVRQAAVPADGTYQSITYRGMAVLEPNLEANIEYIESLLY